MRGAVMLSGLIVLMALASCGGSKTESDGLAVTVEATSTDMPGPSPSLEHADATTPSPSPTASPSPTPTTEASPVDFAWGSIGTIASFQSAGSIHIVEHPDDPTAGEQYIVSIGPQSPIQQLTAAGTEPRTVDDLQVGMRVVVAFDGAVASSYPGLASASAVVILRTEPAGSPDPSDTVTMTFTHSLFTGFTQGDPIPRGDAFFFEYTVADGVPGQRFFCGEVPLAPERCQGYGATYAVTLDVPRGAEVHYAVYRLPEGNAAQHELVEQGREVVDMELFTRSHYRYGAQQPGGYD